MVARRARATSSPALAAIGTAAHPRVAGHRGERSLVDEMMHQIGIVKEAAAMIVAGHLRAAHRPRLHRRSAIITGYELIRHRRTRGFSHFGARVRW